MQEREPLPTITTLGLLAALGLLAGCGGSGSDASSVATTVTITAPMSTAAPVTTATATVPEGQCLTTLPDGDQGITDCGSIGKPTCDEMVGMQFTAQQSGRGLDHLCQGQLGTWAYGSCLTGTPGRYWTEFWVDLPDNQYLYAAQNHPWEKGDPNGKLAYCNANQFAY